VGFLNLTTETLVPPGYGVPASSVLTPDAPRITPYRSQALAGVPPVVRTGVNIHAQIPPQAALPLVQGL